MRLQASKVCSSAHSSSVVCANWIFCLYGTSLACAGLQVVNEEYDTLLVSKACSSKHWKLVCTPALLTGPVPATGWYADPKHWRRNTAIAFAAMFACAIPAFIFSARNEQHWQVPARPIPSQRWCKNFPDEKSDRIGGAT